MSTGSSGQSLNYPCALGPLLSQIKVKPSQNLHWLFFFFFFLLRNGQAISEINMEKENVFN